MKLHIRANLLPHFIEKICEAQYDYNHGRQGYSSQEYDRYFSQIEKYRTSRKSYLFGKPACLVYNIYPKPQKDENGDDKNYSQRAVLEALQKYIE